MRRLDVALGERSYPIHIGASLLARAADLIPGARATTGVVIVSNAVVAAHWLAPLTDGLAAAGIGSEIVLVPDGEAAKRWETLQDVITRMLELKTERSSVVLALGGGVVGDLAGFAAAIYQRGIAFVQLPTTLLAQVDSSVGGKTGINHPLGKNMIGAFHQPRAVLIDTDTLSTLPAREFAAGMAEVIKYGAICDLAFFDWLDAHVDAVMRREPEALTHAIAESCRIKAEIVARDELETGDRALLNFGHTFGHAIEAGVGYGEWLHGEAVAAGMLLAAELSVRRGELAPAERDRLRTLLARASLPVIAPQLGASRYRELMRHDKKVHAGTVRFILLRGLGRAYVAADVGERELDPILA